MNYSLYKVMEAFLR